MILITVPLRVNKMGMQVSYHISPTKTEEYSDSISCERLYGKSDKIGITRRSRTHRRKSDAGSWTYPGKRRVKIV